jgi:isoquinoline 1-oxidoreductase beta subunit
MKDSALSRRSFLGSLAVGSLVLGCQNTGPLGIKKVSAAGKDLPDFSPDLFLSIAPDGQVTIVAHRSEMGTGIRTALPMIIADELGADWNRVQLDQAIGDERYGSQNTDGSRSIRRFYERMRVAGATARTMLEQAAAKRWGVPASECTTREHAVVHAKSNRRLDFKDVVKDAATLEVPLPDTLRMRPSSEYRYVGKNVPMVDLDGIITGKAVFGLDFRREGMLYAVIAHAPVLGAPVKSFDGDAAKAVKGVVDVVEIPMFKPPYSFQALGGVAVLANSTRAAILGRRALNVQWGESPNSSFNSKDYEKTLRESAHRPGETYRNVGDVDAAFKAANNGQKVVEADYYVPLLSHAPMEPPCAVAEVSSDRCEIWAPVQNPQAAQDCVSAALGIDKTDVICNVTLLGGGFGRKSKPDYCAEAAILARATKRPIHVTWTREDDIRHDYYHTVTNVYMKALVDKAGKPSAWLQRSAFPSLFTTFNAEQKNGSDLEMGLGFTDVPYDVPNIRVENGHADAHLRIGWFRSVNHIPHAMALCSFPDEIAHMVGKDPLDYLLQLLGKDRRVELKNLGAKDHEYPNHGESLDVYSFDIARLRHVTERVAKNAKWRAISGKLPRGRGIGIACHRCFLSYVAHVVEVEVSKNGDVKIPQVHVVVDAGKIIQPDFCVNQLEGGAIMAASVAMHGEITATNGSVDQSNFDKFKVARMNDAPRKISVDIIESDAPAAGIGEVGVPTFAPALCNAIFAATGKRIRRLPLSKQDLSWS